MLGSIWSLVTLPFILLHTSQPLHTPSAVSEAGVSVMGILASSAPTRMS